MKDIFNYKSPLGILGKLADSLFLEEYMRNLLLVRNEVVKGYAERAKVYIQESASTRKPH